MRPKPYLRTFLALLGLWAFPASTFAFSGTGSGTEPDPYVITNVEQLQEMQDDLGAYYVLGNDIDASDTVNWNGDQGFVPIGNDSNSFTGKFDGQGYTITGMYINRPTTNSIALFRGTVGAEIKNVGMVDVDITGSMAVGALVNYNDENSTIRNCWSSGNVRSTYVGANTSGIGGLVGSNADGSLISQCYSNINVIGSNAHQYGGLVGRNIRGAIIEDCYATGDVSGGSKVGGLVGDNSQGSQGGYVARCYSTGQVTGSGGGLIGYNYDNGVTYDSYWDEDTSGKTSSRGGTGKTTAEMMQQATFANWDFVNTWDIEENVTYPFLREAVVSTGPIAHWRFDEGTGATAYDSAGTNDGDVYGAGWVDGIIDGALDFDGVDDYVEIPHNDNLSLVSEGTVVAWINLNNTVRQGIVTKQPSPYSGNYFLMVGGSGNMLFTITNGTWAQKVQTEDPTSCPTNQWVLYVGTFNTSFVKLYKNGIEVDSKPNTITPTTTTGSVNIGHWAYAADEFANGTIDDVRIYNRALSEEEIEELYGFGGNVIFSDDFESGTLDQWTIGGRQRDDHGGINIAEVIYRNSSQMAHIHHSLDTTEITLGKLLEYCPNLIFNFDMEVSVSSIAGPTDDDYAMGGAFFDFLDSSGELIGFVRYICSTSSYPFTTYNPPPSREYIALPDSSLHSYSFTLEDILSHITVDTDSIAYINFSFWAYNSGFGWNMSADVWVDNVVVSVPELVGLEIVGPDYVADNFTASYKAIAYYDNNETKDVTHSVLWAVEPNTYADIDDNGVLTTKDIYEDRLVVILADYAVGGAIFEAEKVVDIFPICPTGTALEFDGVDDYVDVGDRDSLDFGPSDSFSISTWINTHEVDAPIVNKRRCGGYGGVWYEGYHFRVHLNKLYFSIEDIHGTSTEIFANTIVTDDKWHHVAAVRDTAEDKLCVYVDGGSDATPVTDNTTETLATSKSLDIGRRDSTARTAYVYLGGSLDDVRIYNRALSAEEIRANMHIRLQGDEPGLVGYWDFDEGEGQIIYDLSGNGNDGQLGSTPNPDASDPTWIESDAPVGLCAPYLITKMAISRAIKHKLASLEELQAALAQEAISIDALDELIKSGDFGNLELPNLLKAKSTIHKTILAEKLCSKKLNGTINDLKIALAALDGRVPPPGWPKLDMEIELEMADVSSDGVVDFRDFAMLANQWLKSYQPKK